jgi:ribosomal-protein-alanine N-acetyltransferase
MMSIRRARFADLRSILRIEKKSFAGDAWDRALFLDYFEQSDRSVFLVSTMNYAVVGYALAFHGGKRAELYSIAVEPRWRGQGVAIALLKRVLSTLRRRGVRAVYLNVRLGNKAAIGLYRRAGFQRVRRVNGYYEDGAAAWRMRKPD